MSARTLVLSDLHLGPDGPLTVLREQPRLACFFERLRTELEAPLHLVLAGDCFDFLLTPDYRGFDPALAPDRLDAILAAPANRPVLDALRTLLRSPLFSLTVLSGNHDPELLLPEVRTRLEWSLEATGRIVWPDDQPLVTRDGEPLPVWGLELTSPDGTDRAPVAWVIHGDRWDRENHIDRDGIRKAVAEGREVPLPLGSRLVYEVLSRMKLPDRLWIDSVKPEWPAVVLLLWYLEPELLRDFLKQHLRLTASLIFSRVDALLMPPDNLGRTNAPGLEPVSTSSADDLAAQLAADLRTIPESERRALVRALRYRLEEGGDATGPGTLGPTLDAARFLTRRWLEAYQGDAGVWRLEEEDGIQGVASRVLPSTRVRLLIAGHTHFPRVGTRGWLRYLNTGTWLPVGGLPEGSIGQVVQTLRTEPYAAPAPCTYAEVRWEGERLCARLGRVEPDGRTVWLEPRVEIDEI